MLEYIILGFLMINEFSGYDLKQRMAESTAYFYDASFGSIYPALKRLEQKGMITCREIVEGGKYKKLYKISDSGKEAFRIWLEEPITFVKSRHDFLVKIFFYSMLPKEKAVINLKAFVTEVEPVLNELSNYKNKVAKKCDPNQFIFGFASMKCGIDYFQFIINWCNDLIKKLEEQ